MLLRGLGRVLAYGDWGLTLEARCGIAVLFRHLAKSEPPSTSMEGSRSRHLGSDETGRFGVDGQQSALGMGNPEADTSEKWESRRMFITVEPESAAGASQPQRRAWQHHSTDTRKSALVLRRFRR